MVVISGGFRITHMHTKPFRRIANIPSGSRVMYIKLPKKLWSLHCVTKKNLLTTIEWCAHDYFALCNAKSKNDHLEKFFAPLVTFYTISSKLHQSDRWKFIPGQIYESGNCSRLILVKIIPTRSLYTNKPLHDVTTRQWCKYKNIFECFNHSLVFIVR